MAVTDHFALQMLQSLFCMSLLTLVMCVWMSVTRSMAMSRQGVTASEAGHTDELQRRMPSRVRRVADNYNHLLEAPTVFYATTLAIVAAGLADATSACACWIYFGSRVLHSLVQATVNFVPARIALYAISWMALSVLIVRPALILFA